MPTAISSKKSFKLFKALEFPFVRENLKFWSFATKGRPNLKRKLLVGN